jgi:threonine/homoserine/homoserine lactone efflux protein
MLQPIIEGLFLGFTLSIMMGPAFFALLQTSVSRGIKCGLFLAFGIFLSDFLLVAITYLGIIQLFDFENNNVYLGIIGGIVLIVFGTATFTRRPVEMTEGKNFNGFLHSLPNPLMQLIKGFFLNLFNPFLIIWWMTIVVNVLANYENDTSSVFLFFGTSLLVILLTDTGKVYVASRLKAIIRPSFILWVNRVVGSALVIFGIVIIFRVFYG